MSSPRPTVGRLVHFFPTSEKGAQPWAALITGVHSEDDESEAVALTVFPPAVPPLEYVHIARYGDTKYPVTSGRWDWPERV